MTAPELEHLNVELLVCKHVGKSPPPRRSPRNRD